jgi:Binding-protein-dependent transport system inner membrane component
MTDPNAIAGPVRPPGLSTRLAAARASDIAFGFRRSRRRPGCPAPRTDARSERTVMAANWVQYARTVRGSTIVEKNKEYLQAARVIGVPPLAIMRRHQLPNVRGPMRVLAINLPGVRPRGAITPKLR